jgi:hypothetical protein
MMYLIPIVECQGGPKIASSRHGIAAPGEGNVTFPQAKSVTIRHRAVTLLKRTPHASRAQRPARARLVNLETPSWPDSAQNWPPAAFTPNAHTEYW